MDERFLIGQPVSSLQHMLGELSYAHELLPFVAVDGEFGEETLEAVMTFQREFAPPVTGRVDQRTWDEIVRHYRAWERERAHPRALRAFPPRPFQVEPGDRDDTMVLAQSMFRILSDVLDGIVPDEMNGYHGERSVHNTCWLQGLSRMEQTGIMDRFTWNMLVRLYDLFLVRRRELEERVPMARGTRKK